MKLKIARIADLEEAAYRLIDDVAHCPGDNGAWE